MQGAPDVRGRMKVRHRRLLIAGMVLLCVGFVLSLAAHKRSLRRDRRAERLITDIEQAGVIVEKGMPSWERMWSRIQGRRDYGTSVTLSGRSFTRQWLQLRNYLTDIEIADLIITDAAEYGHELTTLVERHPIESLSAPNTNAADELAKALADKSHLRMLELGHADLTDAGLQQIPLKRLIELDVALTDVTADGLKELRRCNRLRALKIDGRQLTPEVIAVLEAGEDFYTLTLVGPEVTDASLELLTGTRNMYFLNLDDTSVTRDAVEELDAGLPACAISVRPQFPH